MSEANCVDRSNTAKQVFECDLTLSAVSRARGGHEASDLLDAIHTALERSALDVSGYILLHSRFVSARAQRTGNGQSERGTIRFQFVLAT